MYSTRVLAFLALLVGLAHSFSWDIVVGVGTRLEFYYNGTQTHAEVIGSAAVITSVTYNPVQDSVLFAEHSYMNTSISSFDLSTRSIQPLVTRVTGYSAPSLAYDPVTQFLFWMEGQYSIYSLSLNASSNESGDGNLFVTFHDDNCGDIAVDSCGGFIYWITNHAIERAVFDGSKREVLLDGHVYWRRSLVIDQQTQKMYWLEETKKNQYSLESADLNGENRRTFYFIGTEDKATELAVSKDFIYWRSYDQKSILQLPKNQKQGVGPIVYSVSSSDCQACLQTAASYTLEEQILGIKSCEVLQSLILSVEECYGSTCHNYCFQGKCSVSAEGQPKCSCGAGYSGERCEVNSCYKHCLNGGVCSLNEEDEPVCQCTAGYEGERCDVVTSLTGDHAEYATQQILRDLRKEAKKVIKEELKHALLFLSDKMDEYETKIYIRKLDKRLKQPLH